MHAHPPLQAQRCPRAYVHSFINSDVCSLDHSFIRLFVRSFARSFFRSFIRPAADSVTPSVLIFINSLIRSLVGLFFLQIVACTMTTRFLLSLLVYVFDRPFQCKDSNYSLINGESTAISNIPYIIPEVDTLLMGYRRLYGALWSCNDGIFQLIKVFLTMLPSDILYFELPIAHLII